MVDMKTITSDPHPLLIKNHIILLKNQSHVLKTFHDMYNTCMLFAGIGGKIDMMPRHATYARKYLSSVVEPASLLRPFCDSGL